MQEILQRRANSTFSLKECSASDLILNFALEYFTPESQSNNINNSSNNFRNNREIEAAKLEKIKLKYGIISTWLGECLIAWWEEKIYFFAFVDSPCENTGQLLLQKEWKKAELIESVKESTELKQFLKIIENCLETNAAQEEQSSMGKSNFRFYLNPQGTLFQRKVWHALMLIPKGQLVSYEFIAASIGNPKAVRAVANAIAHNPIAYFIPCHRVIRKSGELGGYRYSIARKKALIDHETATGLSS